MPPRKPPHRRTSRGRSATLASLMAAGVSAPTLALAEDGLGLTADTITWEPAPLELVASTSDPQASEATEVPTLRLLPSLDDT